MAASLSLPAQPLAAPADAAVLLVLLPRAAGTGGPAARATAVALSKLQQELGAAIRVLTIDEARHASVVRSFEPATLPTCVLMRQGIELWRQPGLPDGELIGPMLLSKLESVAAAE